MKKLFLLIGLAIGLTGLVPAQADNTWVTPQPLNAYLTGNTAMGSGEFFNLNTAYTKEGTGGITVNAAATAYGIQTIMLLGEELTDGTALNDKFFGYNTANGTWETVTHGAGAKATAFPMSSMTFMEKNVTGFILSAAGEVYFTDETGGSVEMTLPKPQGDFKDLTIQYAVRAYTAHVTYPDGEPVKSAVAIKKIADLPVGILAFGKDNLTQLPYYLVQYNYLINNDTLIYQIKFADDGLVECRIGKQNKLKSASDNDLYNLCLDLKRASDTLAFGGNTVYSIAKNLTGWQCNTSQTLEKRRLSIFPKGGTISGTPAYTSIDATAVLSGKSQEALTNATSLLVFVTPRSSVTPAFENKTYAVGDNVTNSNDPKTPYRVVYNGKPADLDNISFTAGGLNPNERYYLYAYLCKAEAGNYLYSTEALVFSDAIKTSPMETPANVTAGEPEGDRLYKTRVGKEIQSLDWSCSTQRNLFLGRYSRA